METREATGIVELMKRDKTGVKLDDDNWYSNNFKPELKNIEVGDTVKVTYKQNGIYKNYETIEVIGSVPKFDIDKFSKARESKDASQLTSYAKDLTIAVIGNKDISKEIREIEVEKLMAEVAKTVAEAYNQIKKIISGEVDEEQTKVSEFAGAKVVDKIQEE